MREDPTKTTPAPQPKPEDEKAGARGPRDKRTPGTDMQSEDSGTTDSGQAPGRGRLRRRGNQRAFARISGRAFWR